MEFRIADTFSTSLAKLAAPEQKAANTTAFDPQMNPAGSGLSFHRLDRAKDPNFWSVRVNADIRIIVYRTGTSLLLAYVAVCLGVMHLAKGLEFRAVAVMACDDEVLPLQERVKAVTDETDLQEVYETERHLLYVACTRVRDWLWVSGVSPGAEFIVDLRHGAA